MIPKFLRWWHQPPLRQRVLDSLSETEWFRATELPVNPWNVASIFTQLYILEREGLVESKWGPVSSDGVNRHRLYRRKA